MNLKQMVLGLGLIGTGFGGAYGFYQLCPERTEKEQIVKYLATLCMGLAGVIGRGYLFKTGLIEKENNQRNQQNLPARNTTRGNSTYQPIPKINARQRKYRIRDEWGREIEMEENNYNQNP